MRILFLPYASGSGTWGCTVYMLAMAQEASRRGHDVVFDSCPPGSRLLRENGFTVREFDGAVAGAPPAAVRDVYQVFESLGLDDPAFSDRLIEHETDVLRELRPDVAVVDMRPTATVSARSLGVPVVALASVGTHPLHCGRTAGSPLDDLARRTARRHFGGDVDSFPELLFWLADRKIATSFPEFEPELRDVPNLDYVGYLRSENRQRLDHLPPRPERLVLAYLSTVGWSSSIVVRSLARSAALADVDIWCVTTAHGTTAQVGDRLRTFDYLPLDELLPGASGLIFHGGQGTALGALFHGLPSIACPGQHYERQYNASRLAELGCGIHASLLDLRPTPLARLLDQIVSVPRFEQRANDARAQLRALPGRAGALRDVEVPREVRAVSEIPRTATGKPRLHADRTSTEHPPDSSLK